MQLGDQESLKLANAFVAKTQSQLEKEKLITQYHKTRSSSAPPTLRSEQHKKKIKKGLKLESKNKAVPSLTHNVIFGNDKQPHSNLYNTRGILKKLNSQESIDLNDILSNTRPSFYTLGDFMEPVHHRVSSDEGTEYEEVSSKTGRNTFGSAKHQKNLRKVISIITV